MNLKRLTPSFREKVWGATHLEPWFPDSDKKIGEVWLEGVDHLIRKPREVHVEDGASELNSIEIVDAEGTTQIVKLRDPLMLLAPAH